MLRSFQSEKKTDAEIATALKQVELTQQLTRSRMNGLVSFVAGPLSTEQIYVMEARSADLIPPESDLPQTPAPDAAAQKSLLDKAIAYVTRTYSQLPALAATKTTLRFQDNTEALSSSSGIQGGAKDVVTASGFSNAPSYIHYINSTETAVTSAHGLEPLPADKSKVQWGANAMIALKEPDPNLSVVVREVQAAGGFTWLRWETINGRTASVYSFTVPEGKTRYALNVCCFPKIKQTGVANFYTAMTAGTLGGGGSGGGVSGNFQTNTEWHNFKTTAPYHGRIFIDAETGIVVRLIVESDLNASDLVHQLDTRVDYGPVKVANAMLVVPVKTFVNTVVVPHGDSGAGGYTTRTTLFTSEYKDYRQAQ